MPENFYGMKHFDEEFEINYITKRRKKQKKMVYLSQKKI
jgi:hypothetical protein